ncbi:MAG: amidohydrolase [Sphingomonas sp.]|uniref:Amidohydrolase family protein n=1 Tax=Sphingomonas lycopersici TaxID=2951807 RepID=A0AA41Z5Z5_9SPHN|nr:MULTISPECIES: amidohydrolase family protein [Sphingomonas]MBV8238870.1 amidohydrolase [Sphingomonas sp.]MCW6533528.1 amidohydrolase family protein [Sphingomonas lycopersici]OJU17892.1 MAG: 4-hydroxyphenyl-beta-ketoacyl-CoA hydrolase [Sphingomonas sp. 66-10]
MPIDPAKVAAIDVHVHAEVSCHDPEDPVMAEFFDAASTYFKADRKRPTIPETIAYYREKNIAFCLFTVDAECGMGAKRISNYEVAEIAAQHDDIVIPFASIDPHKGKYGAREARDLIENYGVKGFKFHGIAQNAHPADRIAYPIYEVIAEYGLPAIFHTGHSGMGTGMPAGGGLRLKYGQPMLIDDVAVDFPTIKFILAHPSWPWTDESLSMALHKDNVFIDLSGWSPKYFPKQVIQYANTQLKHKMMFGSDWPLIRPEKWIDAAREAGFRDEVLPLIMKDNAARVLGLG